MTVTIGHVTIEDGRQHQWPPSFPDGPIYVVVDSYRHAHAGVDLGGYWLRFNDQARDNSGWFRAISLNNPDALYGIEPGAILDFSSRPHSQRFTELLAWRASRANINIVRCPHA